MESVQISQVKYIPGVFIISLGGAPNVQREYFAVRYSGGFRGGKGGANAPPFGGE